MPYVADLHIHSHYSRATSKDLTLPQLAYWARRKGVHLVATGDIAHPGWLREIREHLEPAEDGLFRLKPEYDREVLRRLPPSCQGLVRFVLGGEISTIYKKHGKVRKIHHVVFLPTLEAVEAFQRRLARIGNIEADGRPILGLDSRDLLELLLDVDARNVLIPAHIWTPWFALLGSKSGFDSVEECFEDLTPHIFALETGLSSDPPMNWRVSALDRYTLVSNSDAHSPQKLGREANLLEIPLSYEALFEAIRRGDPETFLGTIEFFPEEGKYHYDGHRKCGVCWKPSETRRHQGRCPVCGQPVTVGVLHRVEELADRPEGQPKPNALPFYQLVPLPEVLGELYGVGPNSKRVQRTYDELLRRLGPEMHILLFAPLEDIARVAGPALAEGIDRMRRGEVHVQPGFDGQYGVIRVFPEDMPRGSEQALLFALAAPSSPTRPEPSRDRAATRREAPQQPRLSRAAPHAHDAPAEPTQASGAPAASVEALLASLNPEQRRAVEAPPGPLLIVAGPGTGKTRTLTARLAYTLLVRGLEPEQVLALTFTNRAAAEMRQRLETWLGPEQARRVPVHTFHSWGLALLRAWASEAEESEAPLPALLTEAEARALLARLFPQTPARQREAWWQAIQKAKRQALDPEEAARRHPEAEWVEVYRAYQDALEREGYMDFGDLLLKPLRRLEADPDLRRRWQDRYRWIGVDEYQDLNEVQYRLLRCITRPDHDLTVIGDPNQAIYGFRGASARYFLRFREDYPGAREHRLVRNYRSAPGILRAAQAVLPSHPPLEATRPGTQGVDVWPTPTDRAEAETIVHAIEQMVGGTSYFSLDSGRVNEARTEGLSFGDIAVLVRTRALLPPLQEALDRAGMPYRVVSDALWLQRPGVRALLALLQLVQDPGRADLWDALLAHWRVPSRVRERWAGYVRAGEPVLDLLAVAEDVPEPVRQRLQALFQVLAGRAEDIPVEALGELRRLWQQPMPASGNADPSAAPAAEDWERLLLSAEEARRQGTPWRHWVMQLHLAREHDFIDPRSDHVHILTLHAAKGLEFPVVFLAACEDDILPYRLGREPADEEEERRLFYVGMTRARERLILTWARKRRLFGQLREQRPSPFLALLPEEVRRERAWQPPKRSQARPAARQLRLF